MKPFEDILPEEEGNNLVDLLQQAPYDSLDLKPAEQKQITQRVRELLLQTSPDTLPENIYEPGQILTAPGLHTSAKRRQRLARLVSSLVAVLVVGVIITSALLLFVPQKTIMTDPAIGQVKALATTRVQADGFEMTLGITPGPYFIREMLEVNITLTNHTSKAQFVSIPFTKSPCGYASGIGIQEDLKPTFELPPMDHSCPAFAGQSLQIAPGQTLSAHTYFVLQWSGTITLTSYITFRGSNKDQRYQPVKNPLEGHWPTLHLHVASQVPQNRQLTLHITGAHVTVDAPAPARAHLQYLYGVSCTNGPGSGTEGTGNYGWQPIQNATVNRPGCSMKHITWTIGIGAPGYAIASGKAQSDT